VEKWNKKKERKKTEYCIVRNNSASTTMQTQFNVPYQNCRQSQWTTRTEEHCRLSRT